jgi:hypothetical protein
MADAPVQGITLDPNLTVNAMNQGMAARFNYGESAQQVRQAGIANTNAATANTIASTSFNYGAEAQKQQAVRTNILEQQTATTALSNDIALYDFKQRQVENQRLGELRLQNKENSLIVSNAQNSELVRHMSTPVGQAEITQIVQAKARTDANQAVLNANKMDFSLRTQGLSQEAEYAQLEIDKLNVERQRQVTLNRQSVPKMLNDAIQSDLLIKQQTGIDSSQSKIELLNSLATSDYQAFADNADILAPIANQLGLEYGLAPQTKAKLQDVQKAANYHVNGTAIQNTVGAISQARSQGQATPQDAKILASISEIGIDAQDPSDLLNMTIEKVGSGYAIKHIDTGEVSSIFTKEEYDSSPNLQALGVAARKRQLNRENPLTKADIAQQKLKAIENSPLNGTVGERFTEMLSNVAPDITDNEAFMKQAVPTLTKFQQDLSAMNPFFGPRGEQLYNALDIGEGSIEKGFEAITDAVGLSTPDNEQFNAMIGDQSLARNIVKAYEYRETGGLPPAIFNSTVNKLMQQTMAQDPERFTITSTNDAEAVRIRTLDLRERIQRSLQIPTNPRVLEEAYNKIVTKYPEMGSPTAVPVQGMSLMSRVKDAVWRSPFSQSKDNFVGTTTSPRK